MCRTTDYYPKKDRSLRLKSISLRLSLSSTSALTLLPETLTLVFLPRINDGLLEINASKYKPDSPAFLSLHRIVLNSEVVFSANDRVRACDGVVFEVHAAENRLIRGVLRRYDDGELRMECRCVLERESGVREAEVVVAAENGGVMREKVVAKRRRRRRRSCRRFEVALVEIPEVEEDEEEEEECCCCGGEGEGEGEGEGRSDGGDEVDEFDQTVEMEKEMEGVRWAVDVGIWAVCLGVGFLVSRASVRNLRRRKFLV